MGPRLPSALEWSLRRPIFTGFALLDELLESPEVDVTLALKVLALIGNLMSTEGDVVETSKKLVATEWLEKYIDAVMDVIRQEVRDRETGQRIGERLSRISVTAGKEGPGVCIGDIANIPEAAHSTEASGSVG